MARPATQSRQPALSWEFGLSFALHATLVVTIIAAEFIDDNDEPLFNPEDVMMVSAAALPKSMDSLPDKAMRTPDPVEGSQKAEVEPPPPTASDMVLEDPEAEPNKGDEPEVRDRSKDREELLRKAMKDKALNDMSAPIGSRDQTQTDPDGVDPEDAILGLGGVVTDPVLARYIAKARAALLPNWTPLPGTVQNNPNYVVHILVKVSASGNMTDPKVIKGTGDASFDRSALMAVYKTAKLPPPPEAYRASAEKGVVITLAARDAQ